MKRSLSQSITTGVIFGAVLIFCIFSHPILFTCLIIGCTMLCLFELNSAIKLNNLRLPIIILAFAGVIIQIISILGGLSATYVTYIILIITILVYCYACGEETDTESDLLIIRREGAMLGIFALTYLFLLPSFLVLTMRVEGGQYYVLLGLLLVVMSDTGGMIVGGWLGKHKLAKVISPNKSWEGLIGSIVFSTITSFIFCYLVFFKIFTYGHWYYVLIYGILIPLVSTFGDLIESTIKRDLNIKDMGTLLAGHGGFLDRLDSVILSAPVIYYFSTLILAS